jgi:hypothetical protein
VGGRVGEWYVPVCDMAPDGAADASWQPNPWVWVGFGFIFGHVFLMPIYLARRWWTVGLDWSKLPLINSGNGRAG